MIFTCVDWILRFWHQQSAVGGDEFRHHGNVTKELIGQVIRCGHQLRSGKWLKLEILVFVTLNGTKDFKG